MTAYPRSHAGAWEREKTKSLGSDDLLKDLQVMKL